MNFKGDYKLTEMKFNRFTENCFIFIWKNDNKLFMDGNKKENIFFLYEQREKKLYENQLYIGINSISKSSLSFEVELGIDNFISLKSNLGSSLNMKIVKQIIDLSSDISQEVFETIEIEKNCLR